MSTKEQILNIVRSKGPVIPNQIKKEIGGETYFISALLSELSKEGVVKISHTKIGGTPAYYAPGQEHKLIDLKKYLNEKDQRTVDLLKEKQVLRDIKQEMLIRVSLRKINDFAKPIDVKISGEKEIFWKWHLTPASEVENLIRQQFKPQEIIKPVTETIPTIEKEEIKEPEPLKEEIKESVKDEPEQEQLISKVDLNDKEGLLKDIYKFFNKNNIEVLNEKVIRKNSEIEFRLLIPSAVGKVEYFCKAKSKKRCNDGDLSSAYLKGQVEKVPVLFLTTSDVTKKAREMLQKEFKGLVLKVI